MSRFEWLIVAGVTLVLGGVPLAIRSDGLGAGDPARSGAYRAAGLGLTAVGVPALWLAALLGPPAAGGSGRRIL